MLSVMCVVTARQRQWHRNTAVSSIQAASIWATTPVRVATRTVNGDGCHEAMSLKVTHHISSTDRRHHLLVQFKTFLPWGISTYRD